jgi:hypothetical protein
VETRDIKEPEENKKKPVIRNEQNIKGNIDRKHPTDDHYIMKLDRLKIECSPRRKQETPSQKFHTIHNNI